MSKLKKRLAQDKALRDEARDLITADIAHAKALVAPANLRERTVPPTEEKAKQLLHGTRDSALNHKGTIAAMAGAAISAGILWIVREPLMELIEQLTAPNDAPETEPENTEDTADHSEDRI